MNTTPTPLLVRTAHTLTRMNERKSYDKRIRDARANGYRGPVTRAELAAQCLRRQQDNT
jgi:hypothetical protein